jgi:hypothetical protein
MKTSSISLALAAWCCLAPHARGAEPQEITILDYVAQLPREAFEGTASDTLRFIRGPGNIVDKKNGYIRCKGDGGQGDFEVALFRYSDRRPLVAVSTRSTDGENWTFLEFFAPGDDGKMHRMPSSIFPIGDGGRKEDGEAWGKWRFELPRYGKTILVRKPDSGKIVNKVTWTGEKFVKEK